MKSLSRRTQIGTAILGFLHTATRKELAKARSALARVTPELAKKYEIQELLVVLLLLQFNHPLPIQAAFR